MYALTVKQPWAWAIAKRAGDERFKGIENRTWNPPRPAIGQLIAIHAGKSTDSREGILACGEILRKLGFTLPVNDRHEAFDNKGCIIAVARLVGTVTADYYMQTNTPRDPWFFGPIGWQLEDVVAIDPIPC